jgi:hypothetical protein
LKKALKFYIKIQFQYLYKNEKNFVNDKKKRSIDMYFNTTESVAFYKKRGCAAQL